MLQVIKGSLSFVGYTKINHSSNLKLPKIKSGILPSYLMVQNPGELDEQAIARFNLIYAKNHSLLVDLKIIFKNFKELDR